MNINNALDECSKLDEVKNPYFTPYGISDVRKVLNGKAPTYYYELDEIEMDYGDGAKVAAYAEKLGLEVRQDMYDDTYYIPGKYHWSDCYFYPYPLEDLYLDEGKSLSKGKQITNSKGVSYYEKEVNNAKSDLNESKYSTEDIWSMIKKYNGVYYWEDEKVIDCSGSAELKAICKELGIDYDEAECIVDSPVSHKIYLNNCNLNESLNTYYIYKDGEHIGEVEASSEEEAINKCYNGHFGLASSDDMFEAELADDLDEDFDDEDDSEKELEQLRYLLRKEEVAPLDKAERYEMLQLMDKYGDIIELENQYKEDEYDGDYIYLFPLDEETLEDDLKAYEGAEDYGLDILGINRYEDEVNLAILGSKEALEDFSDDYLGGYELHPDYLYKEEDFAGDIEPLEEKLTESKQWVDDFVRDMAKADFKVGHTFDPDDFSYFKRVCAEDGCKVTREDFDKYFEILDKLRANENLNEEVYEDKYLGSTWSELINSIEKDGYQVDAADKQQYDKYIHLYKDNNTYVAEVTKYYEGDYELMKYNIVKAEPINEAKSNTYEFLVCNGEGAASRGGESDTYSSHSFKADNLEDAYKQLSYKYLDEDEIEEYLEDDPDFSFQDYWDNVDMSGGWAFVCAVKENGNIEWLVDKDGMLEYPEDFDKDILDKWFPDYTFDDEDDNYILDDAEKNGHQKFVIDEGVLIRYHGKESHIVIPESVTTIGDNSFADCDNLISIEIPASVTKIGNRAFLNCINLTNVTFQSGSQLKYIDNFAFCKCINLASIVIPETVSYIGGSAFDTCKSLDHVVIPKSVRCIEVGVFSRCTNLKNVVLSEGVTEISYEAFFGCYSLESISIPRSLKIVDHNAFCLCAKLKDIHYSGTEEEWRSIRIKWYDGEKWGNDALSRATVHFNSTENESLEEDKEEKQTCCLCGKEYTGWGNNAWPLADGQCCDDCNWEQVIPARIASAYRK